MPEKYYYISSPNSKEEILTEGIKAEINNTILSETKSQLENFANLQLRIRHYSIFEISAKGLKNKLLAGNVTIVGSASVFLLRNTLIKPEFVKHLHDVKTPS